MSGLQCDVNVCRMAGGDTMMVQECLQMLEGRNLIKEMEPGKWVRKVLDNQAGKW